MNQPARQSSVNLYHYRKPQDSESTASASLKFSFKQTLETLLAESSEPEKREDFGYQLDEVYSSKENLSPEDLETYSMNGEGAFSLIPLLPPPEDLCL